MDVFLYFILQLPIIKYMKIYLDIDGVLLTKHGEPAMGLLEFLKKVTEHDCY